MDTEQSIDMLLCGIEKSVEKICDRLECITSAIHKLGLNDAYTEMGAIETLAKEIKNAVEFIKK